MGNGKLEVEAGARVAMNVEVGIATGAKEGEDGVVVLGLLTASTVSIRAIDKR